MWGANFVRLFYFKDMEIKKFNKQLIAFDFNDKMVNATDMAKKYNKRAIDFLKLKQTGEFIEALNNDVIPNNNVINQIVKTYKGGNVAKVKQGTWMCELLAIKFAAWLDPNFEIFIYKTFQDVIKNKLKQQQYQLDYFWDKSDQKDLYS